MPLGARRLDDVKSFTVRIERVDDYGRLYVNDSLAWTNDAAENVFYTRRDANKSATFIERHFKDRGNPSAREVDITRYIQAGMNTLVFEVENSIWGSCELRASIVVNGITLERFPRTLFNGTRPHPSLSRDVIVQRIENPVVPSGIYTELSPSASDNALCSRNFFKFDILR